MYLLAFDFLVFFFIHIYEYLFDTVYSLFRVYFHCYHWESSRLKLFKKHPFALYIEFRILFGILLRNDNIHELAIMLEKHFFMTVFWLDFWRSWSICNIFNRIYTCCIFQSSIPCGSSNGGCEQICNKGTCSCRAGYDLLGVSKCQAKNCGAPQLKYCPAGNVFLSRSSFFCCNWYFFADAVCMVRDYFTDEISIQ